MPCPMPELGLSELRLGRMWIRMVPGFRLHRYAGRWHSYKSQEWIDRPSQYCRVCTEVSKHPRFLRTGLYSKGNLPYFVFHVNDNGRPIELQVNLDGPMLSCTLTIKYAQFPKTQDQVFSVVLCRQIGRRRTPQPPWNYAGRSPVYSGSGVDRNVQAGNSPGLVQSYADMLPLPDILPVPLHLRR